MADAPVSFDVVRFGSAAATTGEGLPRSFGTNGQFDACPGIITRIIGRAENFGGEERSKSSRYLQQGSGAALVQTSQKIEGRDRSRNCQGRRQRRNGHERARGGPVIGRPEPGPTAQR